MTSNDDKLFISCRKCLRETIHDVLFAHEEFLRWENEGQQREQYGDWATDTRLYSVVKCLGCSDIRLKLIHTQDNPYTNGSSEHFYPPNDVRPIPDWIQAMSWTMPSLSPRHDPESGLNPLKIEMAGFLNEVYKAINTNSTRLAAMGIRALLERIMIHEVGDNGSFTANMKAFFAKGYVPLSQQDVFEKVLIEAGHAAMHRSWRPTLKQVNAILNVVEGIIKSIYIDTPSVVAVRQSIPPKAPRIKS